MIDLLQVVEQFGIPAAIAVYVIYNQYATISKNTDAISKLQESIDLLRMSLKP